MVGTIYENRREMSVVSILLKDAPLYATVVYRSGDALLSA
jgi:hypothetical protein